MIVIVVMMVFAHAKQDKRGAIVLSRISGLS
jgi:hypothetical protein